VPAPEFSRTLEKGAWAANAAKPPLFYSQFIKKLSIAKIIDT